MTFNFSYFTNGFEPPINSRFEKYSVLEEFIASHLDLVSKRRFGVGQVFVGTELNGNIITKRGFVITDKNKIIKL